MKNVQYNIQDIEIVGIEITNILPEQKTVVCKLYSTSGLVAEGAGYFYSGENKNIPFELDNNDVVGLGYSLSKIKNEIIIEKCKED